MIKELTELVILVEQTIPSHEAMLNHLSNNDRNVLKLFYAVQTNKFRTEAEAIEKAKVGERTKFRQVEIGRASCRERVSTIV